MVGPSLEGLRQFYRKQESSNLPKSAANSQKPSVSLERRPKSSLSTLSLMYMAHRKRPEAPAESEINSPRELERSLPAPKEKEPSVTFRISCKSCKAVFYEAKDALEIQEIHWKGTVAASWIVLSAQNVGLGDSSAASWEATDQVVYEPLRCTSCCSSALAALKVTATAPKQQHLANQIALLESGCVSNQNEAKKRYLLHSSASLAKKVKKEVLSD